MRAPGLIEGERGKVRGHAKKKRISVGGMTRRVLPLARTQEKKMTQEENGAGDRDRTGDIQLGKLAFYR